MSARAVPPAVDAAFVVRALSIAVAQSLEDSGRAGWVVGLSGGLDSAVAAALAARAVGPERVHALFLPAPATSETSAALAREIAGALEIGLETVDLGPLLEVAPVPAGEAGRRGNLAARFRAALLYDRAAARGALVLGTSDKSELALGYGTIAGDLAADLWPLGDLYKTQLPPVARALGLPAAVIDRVPSGELWPGQTDEEEMGFSYGDADRVLYTYLEERRRPAEIVATGVPPEVVERVLARVAARAHARALPQAPKLGPRTVGLDFLHPRAWRGPA